MASPRDAAQPPKSEPDYESMRAKWATLEEIEALCSEGDVRGSELLVWAQHVAQNGTLPSSKHVFSSIIVLLIFL